MILLLLAACSGGGGDSADSSDRASIIGVVEELGQYLWSPRYASAASQAGDLRSAAQELCTEPSSTRLDAAQDNWWAAKSPWKESDALAFGPYSWTVSRLGPAIDGWPADDDWLRALVEGDDPVDEEMIAGLGSTTTGFPALEWLLYGEGSEALTVTEDPLGARRCALTVLLAQRLRDDTSVMSELWHTGEGSYLDQLIHPGDPGDDFETPSEVEAEIINRMLFTVQDLRETRLGKPLGTDSGGLPQPGLVEAPYSHRSLRDARDSLRGVRDHWTGARLAGDQRLGMVDRIPSRDREDIDLRFLAAIDAADTALAAIPEPLSTAVEDTPATVQDARDALLAVQVLLQVDIAQALQVTVQFNDSDGD